MTHPHCPPAPPARTARTMANLIDTSPLLQAAARLAADGEIGNSDAIALLALSHSAAGLQQVLARYGDVLTAQARAKLVLTARMPLPVGVENQRWEPIFDRHPISGRLYTTASGQVVLNEVQYYNGVMVQVYGECRNLAAVRQALAGSGYQPLLLRHADGSQTAVAQFWAHNLSDTSLAPYNAMFIIVAVVPEGCPPQQATLPADGNGVSCLLPMLDGRFDAASGCCTNGASLYYHRLLDSTAVAIEVGRERMGTDKRPGSISMSRTGQRLGFAVSDGAGRGVARVTVELDAASAVPGIGTALAQAAATAGRRLAACPAGTEYVYPSVARIGSGPLAHWQWRTDVLPLLQRARPDTLVLEAESEDGAILRDWGFEPRVVGSLAHVRGVVTGVPDALPQAPLKVRIVAPERR